MAVRYPDEVDEVVWKTHDHAVNQCRGRLCLHAIAEYFALPPSDVKAIEIKCQVRAGEYELDLESNGTIRRWCTTGCEPRGDTIKKIKSATDGRVDLEIWKNHPLLELLRREPPSVQTLNRHLEQAPLRVRRILMLGPDRWGSFSHHRPELRTLQTLRDTWSWDGFMSMLYLSRRGELLGEDTAQWLPAMCAYDMFPRVVRKTPMILFQWKQLAQCLHRVFWRRVHEGGVLRTLPLDSLMQNVERLLADREHDYALQSGRLESEEQHLRERIAFLERDLERLTVVRTAK